MRPDRLGQIAVVAGALDVVVSGVVPLAMAGRDSEVTSENARRLAAAMAEVAGITRPVMAGLPILAAALIAVGVALLREHPSAPKWALVWSGVALGYLVVMVAVNVVVVWPRIEAARAAAVQGGASESALMGYDAVQYAVVRIALLRVWFPLVLLKRMRRRAVEGTTEGKAAAG